MTEILCKNEDETRVFAKKLAGIIKRGDRVTRAQLRSSVDNLFPTLEQNMERRRIGSDRAGEHRAY